MSLKHIFGKPLNAFEMPKIGFMLLLLLGLCGCVSDGNQPFSSNGDTASAKAHTDLGAAYFQQRNYEIALEEFQYAIKQDSNFALAYNGLGLVHAALGELGKADAAFKKAIQLDAKNSESHNNYGSFLCSNKRYDEAVGHFLAAVKNPLYATPAIAYTNAGICSVRKGNVKNAESYFTTALQIDPLINTAAYYLADIQLKRGAAPQARQTLQNSLLNNPGPETLWLGIQIARTLGDKDNEASYALLLRQRYPNSLQTQWLTSGK